MVGNLRAVWEAKHWEIVIMTLLFGLVLGGLFLLNGLGSANSPVLFAVATLAFTLFGGLVVAFFTSMIEMKEVGSLPPQPGKSSDIPDVTRPPAVGRGGVTPDTMQAQISHPTYSAPSQPTRIRYPASSLSRFSEMTIPR